MSALSRLSPVKQTGQELNNQGLNCAEIIKSWSFLRSKFVYSVWKLLQRLEKYNSNNNNLIDKAPICRQSSVALCSTYRGFDPRRNTHLGYSIPTIPMKVPGYCRCYASLSLNELKPHRCNAELSLIAVINLWHNYVYIILSGKLRTVL